MEVVWSVQVLDGAVMAAIAALLVILLRLAVLDRKGDAPKWKAKRDRLIAYSSVLFLALGVFVAYSSFRNQMRMEAENSVNSEGLMLYDIEIVNPDLRCLYDNYGLPTYDKCLRDIVSDPERWSKTIFYVEEVWFVFERAGEDRKKWGSKYAEAIKFWADDVSKDPTGMFSYYLVASEDSVESAIDKMKRSGVCIRDLCQKYNLVLGHLRSVNGAPSTNRCVTSDDLRTAAAACSRSG